MASKFIKQNIGIDISMDTFWATITVLTTDYDVVNLKSNDFLNNANGFKEMKKWIKEHKLNEEEIHFTMEATGVYYENLAHYLHKQNYFVHVVLPNKAKKFAESLDNKSKTDKLDSKALGRLGVERKLRRWEPAAPIYKELRDLTRERERLIKVRTQLKNSLHALMHSYQVSEMVIERTQSLIENLNDLIKDIEKDLSNKIKKDKCLKEKIDKLTTITGVGELTTTIVVAETNGFANIENTKQLCSYAGYDVKVVESGKWKGQSKISKRGNSHIRGAMYLPAVSAISNSQYYKAFYERIMAGKKNGKKGKVGVTAVGRKLLILMYSMWKNDTVYEEKSKAAA